MNIEHAVTLLEVKELREDTRTLVGIATTPTADRSGDIVEPKGAKFSLPIPLLWQHKQADPIGKVTAARVTDAGIEIEAHLPAGVSPRIDEAWAMIREGIVKGLSIGFTAAAQHVEKVAGATRGRRFKSWDWHELSVVTIPANQHASISVVRSLDLATRGQSADPLPVEQPASPLLLNSKGSTVKTTKEQIADLMATRNTKAAEASQIMQKSIDEGRATEAEEGEKADTLLADVARLDKDIERLKSLELIQVTKATPVVVDDAGRGSVEARSSITVVEKKLPPGVEFARFVMCLGAARGDHGRAYEIAKHQFPDTPRVSNVLEIAKSMGPEALGDLLTKANVVAGTTTGTTFAAPLAQYAQFAGDFLEFIRPQTIIGKFGQNGVPALRRVPFMVQIPGQTGKASAYWVGEGKPKPLSSMAFANTQLAWAKIATIVVLTKELLKFSNPSAETLVRDEIAKAVIERADIDFIDPAKAAAAGVSPASITNTAPHTASAGGAPDDVLADIRTLMGYLRASNVPLSNLVLIGPSDVAVSLGFMQNALGAQAFPAMGLNGGSLAGIPFIASDYVPHPTAGSDLILVNASEIYLADDGQVTIDVSTEASLQMLDNPTNDSVTPTATSMVSMFQTNSAAFLAERYINWSVRRAGAVAYVTGVNYDGA